MIFQFGHMKISNPKRCERSGIVHILHTHEAVVFAGLELHGVSACIAGAKTAEDEMERLAENANKLESFV